MKGTSEVFYCQISRPLRQKYATFFEEVLTLQQLHHASPEALGPVALDFVCLLDSYSNSDMVNHDVSGDQQQDSEEPQATEDHADYSSSAYSSEDDSDSRSSASEGFTTHDEADEESADPTFSSQSVPTQGFHMNLRSSTVRRLTEVQLC